MSQEVYLDKQEDERYMIKGFSGNNWGDQVSFTVGSSYVIGSILGIIKGIYDGYPKKWNLPRKLLLNNFVNAVGK